MPLPAEPYEDMVLISRRIEQARIMAGLSQRAAVAKAHQHGHAITAATWSEIERGVNRGRKWRHAIAQTLDVRLEWLVYAEGPMRPPTQGDAGHGAKQPTDVDGLLHDILAELKGLRAECRMVSERVTRLEADEESAGDA